MGLPSVSHASVSTKEFIPSDVSGLSKREARLVKNRAAAFLSRQRKREEFELMEMYVVFNESGCLVKKNWLILLQACCEARAGEREVTRPG
jgi:hypothetical protein